MLKLCTFAIMKIKLLCVGKNSANEWLDSIEHYAKRINLYAPFEVDIISDSKTGKKSIPSQIKKAEGQKLLQKLKKGDVVILLDEKGKAYNSLSFSKEIQKYQNSGTQRLIFIIGGAFGFSEELSTQFPNKIRLSDMTFSHQMIRLFFCEQLYRAFTILHNHPYHNS